MNAVDLKGTFNLGLTSFLPSQLLQAAHFAVDPDDFCERILKRTFSHMGFEICLLAKVAEQNLISCCGYCDSADSVELDQVIGGGKEGRNNSIELNLDQELLSKVVSGETSWRIQIPNLKPSSIVVDLKRQSHQIFLLVPFPVFCGEVGFVLLGSNRDKLNGEVSPAELNFLQWIVATFMVKNNFETNLRSSNMEFFELFNNRQRKIHKHLLAGLTNAQIARALHVSVSTVKAEVLVIYSQLGIHKRSELRDRREI